MHIETSDPPKPTTTANRAGVNLKQGDGAWGVRFGAQVQTERGSGELIGFAQPSCGDTWIIKTATGEIVVDNVTVFPTVEPEPPVHGEPLPQTLQDGADREFLLNSLAETYFCIHVISCERPGLLPGLISQQAAVARALATVCEEVFTERTIRA